MAEEDEERRRQREAEQQRRSEGLEAEAKRQAADQKKRDVRFHRMLKHVPETLSPAQLRFLLIALVHVEDFDRLLSDAAEHVAGANEDDRRGADEVMHETIQKLTDTRVARFAVKFALACHRSTPLLDKADFLAEAEVVFAAPSSAETTDEQPEPEAKKRRKA